MSLQAVAWGISVAGWILSPIISKLLDKVLSYCKDDKQKTLSNLLKNVLPRLVLTLEAVEAMEKRNIFEEMVGGLKSAFYDIEDILDELDYIRHQQQLDAQAKLAKKKKDKINVDAEAGPSNQVLKFQGYSVLEFPTDIDVGKLSNLRHMSLCIPGMAFPNIARLTSLRTLDCFKVRIEHGYEIKQLRDLNKFQGCLTIADVSNVKSKNDAHEANLAAKTRLTELRLIWQHGTASPEVEAEVLEGLCPPMGLKSLEIQEYQGLTYPSWMVGVQNGGPKFLNTLLLFKCHQLGPAPELFECFSHLREFIIWRSCWEYFPDNFKDLKWLKSLTIEICLNLKALPELPRSLENFTMVNCERDFTESCNQVDHPNWQKLQHVKGYLVYHSYDF